MDVPGAPPCGEAVDAQSAERTEHKENNGAADKVFPNTESRTDLEAATCMQRQPDPGNATQLSAVDAAADTAADDEPTSATHVLRHEAQLPAEEAPVDPAEQRASLSSEHAQTSDLNSTAQPRLECAGAADQDYRRADEAVEPTTSGTPNEMNTSNARAVGQVTVTSSSTTENNMVTDGSHEVSSVAQINQVTPDDVIAASRNAMARSDDNFYNNYDDDAVLPDLSSHAVVLPDLSSSHAAMLPDLSSHAVVLPDLSSSPLKRAAADKDVNAVERSSDVSTFHTTSQLNMDMNENVESTPVPEISGSCDSAEESRLISGNSEGERTTTLHIDPGVVSQKDPTHETAHVSTPPSDYSKVRVDSSCKSASADMCEELPDLQQHKTGVGTSEELPDLQQHKVRVDTSDELPDVQQPTPAGVGTSEELPDLEQPGTVVVAREALPDLHVQQPATTCSNIEIPISNHLLSEVPVQTPATNSPDDQLTTTSSGRATLDVIIVPQDEPTRGNNQSKNLSVGTTGSSSAVSNAFGLKISSVRSLSRDSPCDRDAADGGDSSVSTVEILENDDADDATSIAKIPEPSADVICSQALLSSVDRTVIDNALQKLKTVNKTNSSTSEMNKKVDAVQTNKKPMKKAAGRGSIELNSLLTSVANHASTTSSAAAATVVDKQMVSGNILGSIRPASAMIPDKPKVNKRKRKDPMRSQNYKELQYMDVTDSFEAPPNALLPYENDDHVVQINDDTSPSRSSIDTSVTSETHVKSSPPLASDSVSTSSMFDDAGVMTSSEITPKLHIIEPETPQFIPAAAPSPVQGPSVRAPFGLIPDNPFDLQTRFMMATESERLQILQRFPPPAPPPPRFPDNLHMRGQLPPQPLSAPNFGVNAAQRFTMAARFGMEQFSGRFPSIAPRPITITPDIPPTVTSFNPFNARPLLPADTPMYRRFPMPPPQRPPTAAPSSSNCFMHQSNLRPHYSPASSLSNPSHSHGQRMQAVRTPPNNARSMTSPPNASKSYSAPALAPPPSRVTSGRTHRQMNKSVSNASPAGATTSSSVSKSNKSSSHVSSSKRTSTSSKSSKSASSSSSRSASSSSSKSASSLSSKSASSSKSVEVVIPALGGIIVKPHSLENMLVSSEVLKGKYASYKAVAPVNGARRSTHKCTGCGDTFLFQSSLEQHMKRRTMSIRYDCSECQTFRHFSNRCTLFQHAKSHAKGAKAYRLNINNASIQVLDELPESTYGTRARGSRDSTDDTSDVKRKFSCKECSTDFAVESCFEAHFQRRLRQMKIRCRVCDVTAVAWNSCAMARYEAEHEVHCKNDSGKIRGRLRFECAKFDVTDTLFDDLSWLEKPFRDGKSRQDPARAEPKQTVVGNSASGGGGGIGGGSGIAGDAVSQLRRKHAAVSRESTVDSGETGTCHSTVSSTSTSDRSSVSTISATTTNNSKVVTSASNQIKTTTTFAETVKPIAVLPKPTAQTVEEASADRAIADDVTAPSDANDPFDLSLLSYKLKVGKTGKLFIVCHECNASFKTADLYVSHLAGGGRKSQVEYRKCDVCAQVVRDNCCMKAHMRIHYKQSPWVCPECGETVTSSRSAFLQHLTERCMHFQRSLLMRCTLCGIVMLFDNATIAAHYVDQHSHKYVKCLLCPMAFKTEANWSVHCKAEHRTAVRKEGAKSCKLIIKCAMCDTVFHDMASARKHLQDEHVAQLGKKASFVAFKCTLCQPQKLFNSIAACVAHLKQEHNKSSAEHMCHHCGCVVPTRDMLMAHRRVMHKDVIQRFATVMRQRMDQWQKKVDPKELPQQSLSDVTTVDAPAVAPVADDADAAVAVTAADSPAVTPAITPAVDTTVAAVTTDTAVNHVPAATSNGPAPHRTPTPTLKAAEVSREQARRVVRQVERRRAVSSVQQCPQCDDVLPSLELLNRHMEEHGKSSAVKPPADTSTGGRVQSIRIRKMKQGAKNGQFKVIRDDLDFEFDDFSDEEFEEPERRRSHDVSPEDKVSNAKRPKLSTTPNPNDVKVKDADVKVKKKFMGQVPTAPAPKPRFACSDCNLKLHTQQAVREHLKMVHGVAPQFPCHLCGNTYESAAQMLRHVSSVHEGKSSSSNPYTCWVCMEQNVLKSFAQRKLLERHLISYHKMNKSAIDYSKFSQSACAGGSETESAVSDATATGVGARKRSLSTERDDDVPIKRLKTSSDATFSCAKCTFTATERTVFAQHIVKHKTGSADVQCLECGLCFSVLPALKRHLFMVHKVKDLAQYRAESGLDLTRDDTVSNDRITVLDAMKGAPYRSQIPNGIKASNLPAHLKPPEKKTPKTPRSAPEKTTERDNNPLVTLECNVCYKSFDDAQKLRHHMRAHGMAFIRSRRAEVVSRK